MNRIDVCINYGLNVFFALISDVVVVIGPEWGGIYQTPIYHQMTVLHFNVLIR